MTIPLVQELFGASAALARVDPITRPFGFRPDQTEQCRSLTTALFAAMLQFVACHELGHHFHGHQSRESEERSNPLFFYDESPSPEVGPILNSQAKEVEADGYAVKMVISNIFAGPRETMLRLLGQRAFTDRADKYLTRLFLLAAGGFFLSRSPVKFDPGRLGEQTHPPAMARMHFIMTGLRTWCEESNRADLLRHLDLKCYQKTMKAVASALPDAAGTDVLYQQSAFISSDAGRSYLDEIVRDIHAVRASMTPWRWQLISERVDAGQPAKRDEH